MQCWGYHAGWCFQKASHYGISPAPKRESNPLSTTQNKTPLESSQTYTIRCTSDLPVQSLAKHTISYESPNRVHRIQLQQEAGEVGVEILYGNIKNVIIPCICGLVSIKCFVLAQAQKTRAYDPGLNIWLTPLIHKYPHRGNQQG